MNTDMLDYLFFTRKIADEFISFLKGKNLFYTEEQEPIQDAIIIKTPESDDETWDELDDFYDLLEIKQQRLLEQQQETENEMTTAGVYIQLANNKQTIAKINPDVMNRMLQVISIDEFNVFIEQIVQCVEQPDDTSICGKKPPS